LNKFTDLKLLSPVMVLFVSSPCYCSLQQKKVWMLNMLHLI